MQVRRAREHYIRWLLATKNLSPHTIRAYEGDIAAFEIHLGAGAPVHHVNQESLVAFLNAQREAGLAARSIRRRASALRGFCAWLSSGRMLPSDPWFGLRVAVGQPRRLPRVLSTSEVERLLLFLRGAAELDCHDWGDNLLPRPNEATTLLGVALMVSTGARVNEAVGIRCENIDLVERSVHLVGKGRRERRVYLANDWLVGLTAAYLRTRVALGVGHRLLLFNSNYGPLTASTMRRRLAKAAAAAGIGSRVTPHMLRHTAATQLIEAGVDIRYIQRLLGHASLSTTELYTHVSDTALKRVVAEADVLGRCIATDN